MIPEGSAFVVSSDDEDLEPSDVDEDVLLFSGPGRLRVVESALELGATAADPPTETGLEIVLRGSADWIRVERRAGISP